MVKRDWQADWERCKKATPEPWHVVVIGYRPDGEAYCVSCTADVEWNLMVPIAKLGTIYDAERDEYVNIEVGRKLEDGLLIDARADAEFIAEARKALPYWLMRVRELEAKWLAEAEEKIRLRYTKTQLEADALIKREENAKLRARMRDLELQVQVLKANYGNTADWCLRAQELQTRLQSLANAARKVVDLAQQDKFDKEALKRAIVWLDAELAELEEKQQEKE